MLTNFKEIDKNFEIFKLFEQKFSRWIKYKNNTPPEIRPKDYDRIKNMDPETAEKYFLPLNENYLNVLKNFFDQYQGDTWSRYFYGNTP